MSLAAVFLGGLPRCLSTLLPRSLNFNVYCQLESEVFYWDGSSYCCNTLNVKTPLAQRRSLAETLMRCCLRRSMGLFLRSTIRLRRVMRQQLYKRKELEEADCQRKVPGERECSWHYCFRGRSLPVSPWMLAGNAKPD